MMFIRRRNERIAAISFGAVQWGRAAFAGCLAFGLFAGLAGPSAAQSVSVPVTPDRWVISDRNERINPAKSLANNGKTVEFLGRSSLSMAKGFAYVRDLDLRNGTIDADLAMDPNGNFVGLAFRVKSDDEYEMFFFRPGASGSIQAIQYTPGLLGANAWQLYNFPKYVARGTIPDDRWFHVRVVLAGLSAKLYLDNAAEPALVVSDLKLGDSSGSIGFWGQEGGGYISNVTYTPDKAVYSPKAEQTFLPGALTDWEISDSFDAGETDPGMYPDVKNLKWQKVAAETPGLVVIQRYRRDPNVIPPPDPEKGQARVPGSKVVFARATIHADRKETRKMYFGYSDEVVVYLNSKPLYAGNNVIGFREPNALGLVDVNNDAVYLPLKKGNNELMLAVTEFFGGWGFICRLEQ
jgi:hypothetical protein